MSGRNQSLMRTRCPACDTIFRVTSEQLRMKAGKVRCGQCQHVFNAFDYLLPDQSTDETALIKAPPATTSQPVTQPVTQPRGAISAPPASTPIQASGQTGATTAAAATTTSEAASVTTAASDTTVHATTAAEEPAEYPTADFSAIDHSDAIPAEPPSNEAAVPAEEETPTESTEAARAAGLVAARSWDETRDYNRWANGPLATDGAARFDNEPPHASRWPFVLVASALSLLLLGQALWHFRSELVMQMPSLSALYSALAVDVPLPRESAQVSIESSDLQSDNARGLFVLNATLKNRAAYDQAWPALELTLTDVNDRVVSRRVIQPAEYLPAKPLSPAFPGQSDTTVKLWVEARNIGAAGYRLYIFYP